ncbi:hypothetical protein EUGRSUZ_L02922, partial [Eucalyptus grandis]
VEGQIHELKNTLTAITAVLLDAEEQQAKNHSLQLWLGRLRDVLYDVEDVLDEVDQYGGIEEKVHRFFSLSNPLILHAKISRKIKEIGETLSKISIEKNQFHLNVWSVNSDVMPMRSREITYSFINKLDVVRIDVDKQKIIEILMRPNDENISVIPIVGIGGLGKTTLAKLVYNDDNQLQTFLRDIIKNKKFLLVLDDVWSNNRSKWKYLRDLLSEGASGSKIIVTTHSLEVASIMGTHSAHNLKGLSHENSMALFMKWAFNEKEKLPCLDLLEIGNGIVKKCQGTPLLLKTLGSLPYTKDEERYWAYIRDSETWKLVKEKKDVLLVLKLSYENLPSHLKRCFAAFSIFPKGYIIHSPYLARLWMALGLISSTKEKRALEDIGVEYVKELWKRSLIQEVEESESMLFVKLHDLVHSLAMIVAQDDCSIPNSKRLHAIIFPFKVDDGVITREFARTCISKCSHLHYLNLTYDNFEELPSSICNLKQLRSLFISENKRLKKVPDTICELQSLRHLFLNGCSKLGKLPKNIKRLKSIQESGIRYLENLQFLGLGDCQNLRVLFEGTCIMTHLRHLIMVNCGGPISLPSTESIALESLLIRDSKLMLTHKNKCNFPPNLRMLSISKSDQVMELLQCLNESACTLESFYVYDCPSFTAIPKWLPNHTSLRLIHLIRCPNLSSLSEGIQSLTALKELCIEHCGKLSKRC